MKVAITGASGFIGREIIPRLEKQGVDLRLVGRDRAKLTANFPDLPCFDYGSLAEAFAEADLVLHLAVRNNDQPGDLASFVETNVDLTIKTLEAARDAGAERFVAVSSAQVFEDKTADPYVLSKRQMEARLASETGIEISILHLPIVYGEGFTGRLAALDRLPQPIRGFAFQCAAALKPTLNAARLAEHIRAGAPSALLTDGQARNIVFRCVKRTADLMFAVGVVLFLWWVLLILWGAVKFTSPGPGIFAQRRLGQYEKPFTLYKFRTMATGTHQAGTHEVEAAAVTPVGRFLRASKLDELPQVWNILRGEISLIGPRPGLPSQVELKEARARTGVFKVRPGITGLAQVEGIDMSTPERLAQRDADYIALLSLTWEAKIALATAKGRGGGDRVKREQSAP